MKILHFIFIVFLVGLNGVFAQSIPTGKCDWKNNAKGAYTIIHDDYGDAGVDGIWQYADTIAFNRGIKFTFGAIASSCEVSRTINGYSNPYGYAKNVMIQLHNHEIINHSHTHTCAINRGWSPCNTTGWGEVANTTAWNTQLHTSHNSIKNNTGHKPKYYIYPYDQFTDLANAELYTMGYIGSRTGWSISGAHSTFYKYGYEANDENLFESDANGFFRTSVQVFDDNDANQIDNTQTSILNSTITDAIANNEWGNRELHNVGSLGWGHVTVNAYRNHLNFVKSKMTSGDLWVGTVSEILSYQIQKLYYIPSANFNNVSNTITCSYTTDNSVVNTDIKKYLDSLTIKTSLTVKINVSNYLTTFDFDNVIVKQGNETLTDYYLKNDTLYVNTYPHLGSFTIENTPTVDVVSESLDVLDVIYPNPALDAIFVKGMPKNILVTDLLGETQLNVFGNQADLSTLKPGVYFVQVNQSLIKQRLIKL